MKNRKARLNLLRANLEYDEYLRKNYHSQIALDVAKAIDIARAHRQDIAEAQRRMRP